MDDNGEQNSEAQEGATAEVTKASRRDRKVSVDRDIGDWKFRPWKGLDHWVNERTGASTFDPKTLN